MDRHPRNLTTDEQIEAALDRAKEYDDDPYIIEAVYRPEPDLEFLMLKLSDVGGCSFPAKIYRN